MTTQYKSAVGHELKLSDLGTIEVAFAQLNVIDHDGDVTLPGAFPSKNVPMSAYGHASWDGAMPVGRGTIREDGDWAVFSGQMFMNTTHGRDAYETLKGLGPLAEFSYGYTVTDSAPGVVDSKNVRMLKALDVHEVSNVLKGAGLGTHLRAIKSGGPGTDLPYAEHIPWVHEMVKALLDRTTDKAEWRAKEGRVLSGPTREDIRSLVVSLREFSGTADELQAFIDEADPQKSAPRNVTLDVLLGIARRNGVPI